MQRSGEKTRSYMCRLLQLASIAFAKLKDEEKRERVLSKFVRSVHYTRLREKLQLCGSSRKMTGPGTMRQSYRKRSTRVTLDGGREHRESGSPTCPVDSQDNGGAEHRGERPTGTDGCFAEKDRRNTHNDLREGKWEAEGLDTSNAGFVDHTTMKEVGVNAHEESRGSTVEANGAATDKSFLEEEFSVRPCQSSLQDCYTTGHIEREKEQRTGGSRSLFLWVETAGEVVSMLLDTRADINLIAHD